jgi:hypothetical protein
MTGRAFLCFGDTDLLIGSEERFLEVDGQIHLDVLALDLLVEGTSLPFGLKGIVPLLMLVVLIKQIEVILEIIR